MSRPIGISRQGTARLANEAWESLLQAHTSLMKRFVSEDMWEGVSIREYDVLYTLSKCPEPIRLGDLQQHVLLSQPALSRMVDRLVSRGLVRRETDPTDARGVLVSLTGEGVAAQRHIGRRHARSVANAMTTALTHGQLVELREVCRILAEPGGSRDDGRQ